MISSLIETILESIDKLLSEGRISWGAVITALLFFNKINKYKEFRARDKRVELRQLRIESKIDDLMLDRGVVSTWNSPESGLMNEERMILKRLFSYLQAVIIRRRKVFMDKLKSRKFWLTILAALIPVINEEFNIHLDLATMVLMASTIMSGVAALAHVDAKKILAGLVNTKVTGKGLEVAFTTFQEAIPYLQEIHADINKLLVDVKKDDGSKSFHDAMSAYAQIKPILDALKHPEPLAVIVEDKVAS